MPFLFVLLVAWPGFWASPAAPPAPVPAPAPAHAEDPAAMEHALFRDCGLGGVMEEQAFRAALRSRTAHQESGTILAIADMTQPSTEKRLYLIDLEARKLLLRTWVAHGKNSGELYCSRVSNTSGSLQTSKGLYRVGEKIISPKHGDALLLEGMDPGVNSAALRREIIIHAADYVSADFIARHGRLGRSFGCPAVAPAVMPQLVELLQGGLLFVYAN